MKSERSGWDMQAGGVGSFWGLVVTGLALLGYAVAGRAVPPPAGVAPVLVPAGGFGIDGKLQANGIFANAGDWMPGSGGTGGSVLDATGAPLNPATTFHIIDPYSSTSDNTFVGGLKWTDNPNTWQWTSGKASSKTDINNALMHITTDTNGHSWVIVAADRLSTSGDSYIDFEFLQNPLTCNSNGTFTSMGSNGGRTTNDLLLSLAFTSGGSVADFFAWTWQTNLSGGFSYMDITTSLPAGRVFVAANTNNTLVPFSAFGQTNYAPNAFAEAAVDVTALLGNFNPCLSIGVKTIMVKTKTSQSSTATIVDFVNPIQYNLRVGPAADAGPAQTQCAQGDSTAFSLQGHATPGLHPIASTTWSVVAGNATIDSPNSLSTTARVASASATLRLTVVQANGCTETSDVVLTVAPLPGCLITGPGIVCPLGNAQFSGPPGMGTYTWTVTGAGVIVGPTNTQHVSVLAGPGCGTNFNLLLTVASNSCPSTCTMTVAIDNTNAPTVTCPPNVVLECPADTSTNRTGVAVVQDVCGSVTLTYNDAATNTCGGAQVIVRTWTAIDACGNSASAVQTITLRDTTPPSLTIPPNVVLECPADVRTAATGIATAQDSCSSVNVSYSDVVSNNCGGTKVIARIWSATDACGNTTSAVQTITVRDTRPPTLSLPPNLVLECPANTTTNATGVATAQDGCSSVTINYSDVISNHCGGTKVIARTWTATDACGNTTNGIQTITVQDTTAPTLILPPNLVLECPANTSTNYTGVATASSACSSVTINYSDVVSNHCGGTKVIARTWTATDACGNSTNSVQTITVQDTTAPTLTLPPNLVLECPANTSTNYTGVATASSVCSSVTINYSDVVSNHCGGTKVIARTWSATDACGNTTNGIQTITVQDTAAPILILPANLVLECPANTSTNATGVATASSACSSVTITYSDVVSNHCGGTKVIARTWTAIDACGNSTNSVQTITVQDTTAPTLTLPANLVLECPANTSTNYTGVAAASSACSSVTITYSDVVSNHCGGTRVVARTWTATDACGNTTNGIQTITVQDTTAPTLTLPPNLVLECPANTSTNYTGVATASSVCSSVTINYSDVVSNHCGGTKVIARTWTATDACGNSTNSVQTITVQDTTAPRLTLPPNLVLECPANTSTNYTGIATASSACSSVTITYSDVVSNHCGGTKVVARTWTATDACGNTTNGLQTITVQDTTAPALTLPPNVVLECPNTNTSTNYTGVASASSACSSVTVTYSDAISNHCGSTRVIARTWTATDACGNVTNGIQTITVRDTTPPTLSVPPDLVLQCPANTSTNVTGVATASDTCSLATVTYTDVVSNTCGGAHVIARVWTATDQCGNRTNLTQTITVRDTTRPTLTVPPDITLSCGASTSPTVTGTATAQDTCSSVSVIYADVITNLCPGSQIITRLWTATDACGNSTNGIQTINVINQTPPNISCAVPLCTHSQGGWSGGGYPAQLLPAYFMTLFPNGLTLGVYAPSNGNSFPNGLFWQPNAAGLAALQTAASQGGGTGGPLTQDALNPTSTYGAGGLGRQTLALNFNIAFNTAGLLGSPPNNFGSLVYTNAGDSLSGSTVQQILQAANQALAGLGLPPGYDFSALAGLVDNLNISFQNCTASSWAATHLSTPEQVYQCSGQVPPPDPTQVHASAGCGGGPVTLTSLPDTISDFTCPNRYIITRTWMAQDGCGNTNTCSFQIQVNDTTPPTLSCSPPRTLTSGQVLSFDLPSASDNCGGGVNVSVLNTVTNVAGTNVVVTRTWQAIDACGNTSICAQSITILGGALAAPVITLQPQSQTIPCGSSASLRVEVAGSAPFAYQWRLNGNSIPGATNLSLALSAVDFTAAGLYSVWIGNAAGSTNSAPAVVNVVSCLAASRNGRYLTLSWPGRFVLQSASNAAGPYLDVPGAVSPLVVNCSLEPQRFFRLRGESFKLAISASTAGQVSLTALGAPGCNSILQASTNLVDWVNLQTNTLPAALVDTNAWRYPRRFYRISLAPAPPLNIPGGAFSASGLLRRAQ